MNEPALYSEINGIAHRVIEGLVDEFGDEMKNMSGCCIDVGSGPSDTANDIILPKLNTKATIVCSDISENMVNFGREKYRDNQRMSFAQLDIETPNLPQDLVEQFDHVLSFYCIHWCQDVRQAFENVFNLLRPGGTAVVSFIAKSPAIDAYKTLAAMPCYQPYMKDVDRYVPVFQHAEKPRETVKALLKDVGFEVEHCSIREISWVYDTREDFNKLMLAVNPFVDRIPANMKTEYENDLGKETAGRNIIFNRNQENENEYSVLFRHHVFVLYLKKPLTK